MFFCEGFFCNGRPDFFVELINKRESKIPALKGAPSKDRRSHRQVLITMLSLSRENMQQPPDPGSRSVRVQRNTSDSSGPTLSTTPVYISATQRQNWPRIVASRRSASIRRVALLLALYGLLLSACFVLLYPLIFEAQPGSVPASALTATFPWLSFLFWTQAFWLVTSIGHISWLDLAANPSLAAANLLLLFLAVALTLYFLAAAVCRRVSRLRVGSDQVRRLLLVIYGFTLLLGVICVFLPGGISQDALLSALYGRLLVVYHVNPYLSNPGLLAHDPLYHALPPGVPVLPQMGPLGLDLTVPLAWLTQANPAFVLIAFRLAALVLHLLNAFLIRAILGRLKPEIALAGTLLYAWNPALLLLGIGEVHAALAVIFFLLLAVLFLQRRALLLGWISFLLSALVNPLCLLLGPLFLRVLRKETQIFRPVRRVLWWLVCGLFSVLVVVAAYAPYWSGLGAGGIALHLGQAFWQDGAQHSLLAALMQLPFAAWFPASWLLTPHHWLAFLALPVLLLLLLGIWITDNVELSLLFGSWIFLLLAVLLPLSSPWLILVPFALALASSSRRTLLLAHLLTIGSLLSYYLLLWSSQWNSQALITIGVPVLIWGWTLFFLATWEMTHPEDEGTLPLPQNRRRLSISRPAWPSRPTAWPSRPGLPDR